MRHKLIVFTVIICVLVLLGTFSACNDTSDDGVIIDSPDVTVENVTELAISSIKNSYYLGEELDYSKFTVKIITGGEVRELPLSDPSIKVVGYDPYKVGVTTFSVQYGAAEAKYSVNILEPNIIGAAINRLPNKTEYIEGEALDMTGCRLEITLDVGSKILVNITNGFVSGFDSIVPGSKTLTINFSGLTVTTTVSVREKQLRDVQIVTAPTVSSYLSGSIFEPAGIVFGFVYDNGITENRALLDIAPEQIDISYSFTSANPESPVRITYTDPDTDIAYVRYVYCTVSDRFLRSNNPMQILSNPDAYNNIIEGREDMDYSGGEIEVFYQDDSSEILDMTNPILIKTIYTDDTFTTIGNFMTAGTYFVRISYHRNVSLGWYVDMPVTVLPKTAVSMTLTSTAEAVNTAYYAGLNANVNINNLKYYVSYDNGTVSNTAAVLSGMLFSAVGNTLSVQGGAGAIDTVAKTIDLSYENYYYDNAGNVYEICGVSGADSVTLYGVTYTVTPGGIVQDADGAIIGTRTTDTAVIREVTYRINGGVLERSAGTINTAAATFVVDGDNYSYSEGVVFGYKKIRFETEGVSVVLKVRVYQELVASIRVTAPLDNAFIAANATDLGSLSGLSIRVKYNHGGEETLSVAGNTYAQVTFENGSTDPSQYVSLGTAHYVKHDLYVTYKGCSVDTDGRRVKTVAYFTDNMPTSYVSTTTSPTLSYIYGDSIRLIGLKFSVYYGATLKTYEITAEDNTTDSLVFTDADNTSLTTTLAKSAFIGTNDYKVSSSGEYVLNYFGGVFSVRLVVTPLTVSSVEVVDASRVRAVYNLSEPFEGLDGMTLTITKNNGLTENVAPDTIVGVASVAEMLQNGFYYILHGDITSVGNKTVSIYYKNGNNYVSTDWGGILYKRAENSLASIALYRNNLPVSDLGSVAAGLSLNLSAYRLLLTYTSGAGTSQADISLSADMLDYDAADVTAEDYRPVTITYSGLTLNTTIRVITAALDHINVNVSSMQVDYIKGELFNYAGGYITRYYTVGSGLASDDVALSNGKVTGFDSNVVFGAEAYIEQTLDVEYNGKTATFTVKIWNKITPTVTFHTTTTSFGRGTYATVGIATPEGTDIFVTPEYTLRYQYRKPDGSWSFIDENNGYYNYYIGQSGGSYYFDYTRTAYSYQSLDFKPHHVGEYRVVFFTEGNDYYDTYTTYSAFTVNTASVNIRANNATNYYGDPQATLGFALAGDSVVWNYAINDLNIPFVGSLATDNASNDVGTYNVTQGSFTHPYFFDKLTFTNANYTIAARPINVVITNLNDIRWTGEDLSSTVMFRVSFGTTVLAEGNLSTLATYFSGMIEQNSVAAVLRDIGDYTLSLTCTTGAVSGNYNYVFAGGVYAQDFAVSVKKAVRTLSVGATNVTVANTGGNEYYIEFDFGSEYDTTNLGWAFATNTFASDNTVALVPNTTTIIASGSPYLNLYFKYFETAYYEESNFAFVRIALN